MRIEGIQMRVTPEHERASRNFLQKTRGDLEPARGNLHVCKFLRDLTNIQIRTVTAERARFVLSAFARRMCYKIDCNGTQKI